MHWTEFVQALVTTLFVELPKIIAWPVAIVILGSLYRTELRHFISRMIEIGPRGAKAVPPIQIPSPASDVGVPAKIDQGASKFITRVEDTVREAMQKGGWTAKPAQEREAKLIREVATAHIKAHFAEIVAQIFGSQLELLNAIYARGPLPYPEVVPFYDKFVARAQEKGITDNAFEKWSGYLLSTGLLRVENAIYHLTDMGHDFLALYLPLVGIKTTDKPF